MCNLISYAFQFLNARVFRTFSFCSENKLFWMPALLPEMETFRLVVLLFMMARTVIISWNNYRAVQFVKLRQSAKRGTRKTRGGAWHQFTPFTEFALLGYSLMAK